MLIVIGDREKLNKRLSALWLSLLNISWAFAGILAIVFCVLFLSMESLQAELEHVGTAAIIASALTFVWVFIASWLIKYALGRAQRFTSHVRGLLRENIREGEPFAGQVHELQSPKALCYSTVYVILVEILIIAIPEDAYIIKVFWSVLVGICFFYAGIGFSGVVSASQAIVRLCEVAHDSLVLHHGDRMAGLRFVRSYADTASLLILTGALVLPMGITLLAEGLRSIKNEHIVLGRTIVVLFLSAILAWGIFSVLATLRARFSISALLSDFQDEVLQRTASQKEKLIGDESKSAELRKCIAEERAALQLKTGFWSGAGAWRDVLGSLVTIATSSAFTFALKIIELPSWLNINGR